MASWDDEDFEPDLVVPPKVAEPPPAAKWKGEDEEEEEEETSKSSPTPKPAAEKKASKKKKEYDESRGVAKDERLADPIAEKMRQQRLVEESDFQNAKELFGGDGKAIDLDAMIPKSEDDFVLYGEMVASKIVAYESSIHYAAMLKSLMRKATTNMKSEEVKTQASSLTVIANEKQKAEKAATGSKKKAPAKKKVLNVDSFDDDRFTVDDTDDYDFM
eukprot:jgi/Chlat1/5224/Chrsp33S05190